jgi:hypothetical protein
MKQYETINWYEKDTDEVYDLMYNQLEEEEKYPFFIWLMQHYPSLDIDWIEIFEDFKEFMFKENKIDEVLSFVNWYQQINPTDYSERYEFIERDLCDYFIYKRDFEKLQERIAFIQQYPIYSIDTLTIRLLYQLIYCSHYEDAVTYSQAVWKPINESEELYGFPAFPFINSIYVNLLQQNYEASLSGFPIDEEKLFCEMVNMGYENDKTRFNEVLLALREDLLITKIQDSILKGKDDHMLILNIHFLKYMLHTYKLPFVFSEWIWNFIATTKIFGKQKGVENWFYIDANTLDKHIADRFDSFMASNDLEIFGKVWGLDFVFDFLYKQQLLSSEQYDNMIENVTYFRNEMMRICADSLWQMMFVFDWPRTNNYFVEPSEKRLFHETYGVENSEAIKKVVRHLSIYQIPERVKIELKIKKSKERNPIPVWSEPTPYVKENPSLGRNELCVCGSGKKYKKCCIDKPKD